MHKQEKLCLGIDTTTNASCVASLDDHGKSACTYQEMPRGQGDLLIAFIQTTLKKMHKTPTDLTHIAVTVGPGSFTGVRIGLATARGLGLALNIPVLGVDNFTATSFCYTDQLPHKIVLDSNREDYFVQDFDIHGHKKGKPTIHSTSQLKKLLPFTACGSGAEKLSTQINCRLQKKSKPMLALAAAQIALTKPSKTCAAHPLYLRDADVTI